MGGWAICHFLADKSIGTGIKWRKKLYRTPEQHNRAGAQSQLFILMNLSIDELIMHLIKHGENLYKFGFKFLSQLTVCCLSCCLRTTLKNEFNQILA
jgi:hypothetical protein